MARGNSCFVEGNLTKDIELLVASTGTVVGRGAVAWNQSKREGDAWIDIPHYFDFTLFGDIAENAAASLNKGDRVVIEGRLDFNTWDNEEGVTQRQVRILAESVNPCLRWATASVVKTQKKDGAPVTPGSKPVTVSGESPF